MSTTSPVNTTKQSNAGKSLTVGFELQTKIRLIIQQVLAATIRKLSHFGDKIEKFQEYFITFKERFQTAQRERIKQQQQMQKIQQVQINIRRDLSFNDIRYNEDKERALIAQKQQKDQLMEMEKQVKTLLRQNQNINSEVSKTKSKFLEYSNIISTLKQQVSWKITKYLQETAQSHTQMKVYSQNIKNDYFNINLIVEKQKEKYDEIIIKYQQDTTFKQQVHKKIQEMNSQLAHRKQQIKKISTKVDDIQFSFLSKIKIADSKFQAKMIELQKNNTKLTNIFKKVDTFNHVLDTLKEQLEEGHNSLQRKMEQNLKKAYDFTAEEILKVNKQNIKLQKNIDKKISQIDQRMEKQEDFLTQKIDFLKIQIQSDMSNKTSKLLEQKSKAQQHLNNSSIEQINGKISKLQFENSKNLSKIQNNMKDSIIEVKNNIQKLKDEFDDKIERIGSASNSKSTPIVSTQGGISNQKANLLHNEINNAREQLKEINRKTEQLWHQKQQIDKLIEQLKRKLQVDFHDLDEKLNSKVERVMFLVTKMRGDSIIRNEFNDKQIKQLKKNHMEIKERSQASWKLIPSIGECIFLILSLIYDAEYQHSRIILDNLPMLTKDIQKFNTCYEGVIYQYKEKKKPGSIFYRHSQIKKTDIVKATFNGYIQVWQEVFQGELKSKQNLLPKSFYKRLVEKYLRQSNRQKQSGNGGSFNQLLLPKPSNNIITENSRNGSQASIDMNSSFHIRKKRTAPVKEREKSEIINPNENFEKINE